MGVAIVQIGYMIAVCVLVGIVGAARAEGGDITLAEGGKSDYTIVLSEEASPSEKHAAQELQRILSEISGASLPIIIEGGKSPRRMIVLGEGETLRSLGVRIDFDDLGKEGFAIKTSGAHLVIAGGRLRGTMYGVYTFLEDILGCRWYTSKASYIPKKRTIILPPLDIVEKPDFEYREPFYADAFDPDWAARNRVNSNSARLDEARGGKIAYHHFVHTFGQLVPASEYFKDHPEYYSLLDGQRKVEGGQLCLTNPDVLRIATETVFRWIEERPDATIFSVSQNDWYGSCQCDACKAVDAEEGSPSGALLRFVNAIAAEVSKKYPDKLIDTLAYQYTEKPPKVTRPGSNVRVRLCPIFACEFHPYEKCEQNAGFVENLRGWSKVTDNLYIWHYNTDFANYLMPFPDLDELASSIPMYKRSGVKGLFTQGNYSPGGGGFMDELKAFLIAKLLWDVDTNADRVIADFLVGYYGKAGKPIGEFLRILHAKVRDDHIHGHIYDGVDSAFLTPEIIAESERLFDEAERLAENPEVLERVKHARLSVEYVKVMREVLGAGASGTPDEKAAALKNLEAFIGECEEDGITQLNEGCPIRTRFEQLAAPLRK